MKNIFQKIEYLDEPIKKDCIIGSKQKIVRVNTEHLIWTAIKINDSSNFI